jgi:glycosyltransferase involved in cell wall biosynthesis
MGRTPTKTTTSKGLEMKLLLIYHAGAVQNSRQIYRSLTQIGNLELSVIVPQNLKVDKVYDLSGWLSVKQEENRDGYRLIPVPLRNPSNYGQGFESPTLRQLIKQIRPDIIHVLDEPTSGYLFQVVWQRLTASRHSKVLFYGFDNLPIRLGIRSRVKWKFTWAQLAGGAVANSETLINLRRAGFPRGLPLERIFWGIQTDVFNPMDSLVLKEELGLDCEYIVGFVGRLIPEKGLAVLLAAVRRLPANVHCLIIGSGPMRAELELWSCLPELNGRIHLCDAMESETLVKYMNCIDVLSVPSLTTPHWKEQYGRVIGEAMACGVPVIGSDSGAIPEVIGSAGLIVPEGNSSALAEAFRTVIFDRETRQRFKQEGLLRAQRELSTGVMGQRLFNLYNHILGG